MIELQGIGVAVGGRALLRDVDLRLEPGGALALVGESGAGKSTVLRAIVGLLPHEGRILVAGEVLAPVMRTPSFRRRVQMVFQDPYGALHPRHPVDRALREPLAIHRLGEREARIRAALDAVGLGAAHRFRYPHELSGGQRQRVAIARALILEPEILLLDEPTSALDPVVQAEIVALLQRLRRERGLAYLIVGHDLAVVAQLAERIAVMREGRVVEEFPRETLGAPERDPYTRELVAASLAKAGLRFPASPRAAAADGRRATRGREG